MMKRSLIVLLVVFVVLTAGCSRREDSLEDSLMEWYSILQTDSVQIETHSATDDSELYPIKVDELEIHIDELGGEPVFWVKNNSAFKIGGPEIIMVQNETGDTLWADANQHSAPGESSDVATFYKETWDEDGSFLGSIPATVEEVNNATIKTIEFDYYDAEGELFWMEYNFITKSYRGFKY